MARVKELLDTHGSFETTPSFLLANEANLDSGLSPLHYAASRGHLEIVKFLVTEASSIIDLEDQTGETALLKAAYNGHAAIVAWLLQMSANVEQKDNDGWTALHNASAQGHLQIVKHLLVEAHANVDVKSNKGHTPLMNAASKGHVDIVEYLLSRGGANPFIKNSFGEIAYDGAAISHEIYICELLEKAEREWWNKKPSSQLFSSSDLTHTPDTNQPYDLNILHCAVPIVIHENQRTSSFFGLSIRGSSKYSANNLLKSDVCGPWSHHPSGRPQSKESVQVPSEISSLSVSDISNSTSSKPSPKRWYWFTDWQIYFTHPRVDQQGWQYSKSFDSPDEMDCNTAIKQ
ncbi:26294_t:CDS:2 [Dentiscutata erythropus]|uniref:26294_t:CDS:1 n=1 Tax=Dentiscutata erythropus TaxID=1348616 RepID=A0A9N8Z3H1_9GLOM|nr:26294_t:CDS:2 [Dentiscutata erythropus]